MTKRCLAVVTLFVVLQPVGYAADDEIKSAINSCRSVNDDAVRLSCYDAVGRLVSQPAAESSETALDAMGAEQLPKTAEQIEKDKTGVRAYVTRCSRAVDKKYIFYLENGQVWRQKSDKRLFFEECRFEVEISKDFFGYKMSKVGEVSRFRVSRMR